jgi:hypothetical protein
LDKETVLVGLVREFIDAQRGVLEIQQVGEKKALSQPVPGIQLKMC